MSVIRELGEIYVMIQEFFKWRPLSSFTFTSFVSSPPQSHFNGGMENGIPLMPEACG